MGLVLCVTLATFTPASTTNMPPDALPEHGPIEDPDPARVDVLPLVYWPDRPMFTADAPARYAVLNSTIGPNEDDRFFVWIAPAGDGNQVSTRQLEIHPGQRITMAIAFSNSGDTSTVATNTRMLLQWDAVTKGSSALQAIISSDNARPARVMSSATVRLPKGIPGVALRAVPDSAELHVEGRPDTPLSVNDLATGGGALIGCGGRDGVVVGRRCRGVVTIDLFASYPDFIVDAWLSKAAPIDYRNEVRVRPGSDVIVKMMYQNTGTVEQDNVVLAVDRLPPALSIVPGTTYMANSKTEGKWNLVNSDMTTGGINAGNYAPSGGNVYVKFTVRVGDVDAIRQFDPEFPTKGMITLAPPIRLTANTDNGSKGNADTQRDPSRALVVKVLGPAQSDDGG